MKIILITIIVLLLFLLIYLDKNIKQEHFTGTKKIAFLFLIKDKINKEELWHSFFNNIDENKYSIYIHYKNNIKLKYFDKYKLKTIIDTKWGDISLVHAQKLLLKEALKDESNYKFIYISDSCIPVKNFDYIYNFLTTDNNSYFNIELKKNTAVFLYNIRSFIYNIYIKNKLESFINKKKKLNIFNKSFQWFILNRENANIINNDETEIVKYTKLFAPDELYFLTTLRNNNASNIIVNTDVEKYTTFANWDRRILYFIKIDDFNNNYKKFKSIITPNKYPYEYIDIDDKELNYIVNKSNNLFMRKILPDTKLNKSILPYWQNASVDV